MWRIGDISIDGRVALGPMSGFTFPSYRDFMKPFGVAVSFTEMTSCMGVIHDSERTASMYLDFKGNRPIGLQLFGGDPDSLAEASVKAMRMNPGIDFIDINMGCPVPTVLRSRSGSALMEDPERCGEIVKAVKRRTGIPVTVKTRLGKSMESMHTRKATSHHSLATDTWAVPRTKSLFLHPGFPNKAQTDAELSAVLCQVRDD